MTKREIFANRKGNSCGLIEAVRMYLIEPLYIKPFFKWGKKIDDKVDEYIRKESVAS